MKRSMTAVCCIISITTASTNAISGPWTLTSPQLNEGYSPTADIAVHGTGPNSTSGIAKLYKTDNGLVQDSFNFTTNSAQHDNPGEYNGDFDIDAEWALGTHYVLIFSNNTTVYPVGGDPSPHNIDIQNN